MTATKKYINWAFTAIVFLAACISKNPSSMGTMEQVDSNAVVITGNEAMLMNVVTEPVKLKTINQTTSLLARAATNENNLSVISSRVKGRLDKLFVRNTGEKLIKGMPIYSIYSEELLADENEYLIALEQQGKFDLQKETVGKFINAAHKKLLLWGLTETQIEDIKTRRRTSPTITFYSDVNGYISELNVNEGEYVESGSPLFKISSLTTIWVETQFYPQDLEMLSQHPDIDVEFPQLSGEHFKGKISVIPPAFEGDKKVNIIKVEIVNTNSKIIPGMTAIVNLKTSERKTMVIPTSAITLDEMPNVWVETGKGKYEMRMIHTGIRNKSEIEVLHGLNEGDKVVVSGAYLLNSAYVLKHGANSMGGMKM